MAIISKDCYKAMDSVAEIIDPTTVKATLSVAGCSRIYLAFNSIDRNNEASINAADQTTLANSLKAIVESALENSSENCYCSNSNG